MDILSDYLIIYILRYLFYHEIIALRLVSKRFAELIISNQFWINLIKVRFDHLRNLKSYLTKTLDVNKEDPRLYYLEQLEYQITIASDEKSYTFTTIDKYDIKPVLSALYSVGYTLQKSVQDKCLIGQFSYISHTQPKLNVTVSRDGINKTYSADYYQQNPGEIPSNLNLKIDENIDHYILDRTYIPYITVRFYFRTKLGPNVSARMLDFLQNVMHGPNTIYEYSKLQILFLPSNQREAELFIMTLRKLEILPKYEIEHLSVEMHEVEHLSVQIRQTKKIDDIPFTMFRYLHIKDGIISSDTVKLITSGIPVNSRHPAWSASWDIPWYTKLE